ncbi:NAD(P)-binding protein [Hypoxylon trugodes]|uniref:NAD(P)-binding protein n=1 Tax=Hypoxylon trugodes TaxID=326681 RepID=UPI0021A25047|nr:NAD(P)-binding protein [Hypoxylon trugodes]KAI1394293.1 NAD(P)-binding protein [Hypoxylon trugodes]
MSTALIIGAGPRVGQSAAEAFLAAGYKVAVASRTQKLDPKFRFYAFDGSKPETVPALFEKVSADLGIPSVVIHVAAFKAQGSTEQQPFDSVEDIRTGFNVNTLTPYVAAQEAVKGFEKLGAEGLGPSGGTFIYVGNIGNVTAVPLFLDLSMHKSASATLVKQLALAAYNDKPWKFYYVDERRENGLYVPRGLSGPGHAELFLDLAKDVKQRPWSQTFVPGKGYVAFEPKEYLPWDVNY